MKHHLDYGQITHRGLVRKQNEDYVGFFPAGDALLAVIADGMGGHNAGETASRICVETMRETFLENLAARPETILQCGFQKANAQVLMQSSKDARLRGMGATIVAAIIREDECWYSHIGDSRIYLVEAGKVKRLTRDHTEVQSMLEAGLITEAQSAGHFLAHIVSKSIGHLQANGADIEVNKISLCKGGAILLCSDGLTNQVADEEICAKIHGAKPQDACNNLLDLVLLRGAHDNVSIQFIRRCY